MKKTPNSKTKKSQHAARARRHLAADVPEIIATAPDEIGAAPKPYLIAYVPKHNRSLFRARASFDTIQLMLEFSTPVSPNSVRAWVKAALGHKGKTFSDKFQVAGLDEIGGMATSTKRCRITIQNPTFEELHAVQRMKAGQAFTIVPYRLDLAVDFFGGNAEDRWEFQQALSLMYPARLHTLNGAGCPRQIWQPAPDGPKEVLYLRQIGADSAAAKYRPYHAFLALKASTYFGSKFTGLETNIYHKYEDAGGKPLSEECQSVRVEVRLFAEGLSKYGIRTLDDVLNWKPSNFSKFFKFEIATLRTAQPTSLLGQKRAEFVLNPAKAGVFAILESSRETQRRAPCKQLSKKKTVVYEKLHQQIFNALQAMSRSWRANQSIAA